MSDRFLFYSHDGVGLGHLRRNIAVASALVAADRNAIVLLAHGSEDVSPLGLPERCDVLRLPGLAKDDEGRYRPRRLAMHTAELRDIRSAVLAAAVESFQPNVLLTDKHPRGASGELGAALESLRRVGGRAALGLRDVLDDPRQVRKEFAKSRVPEAIKRHHDLVLVYGRREVYDPVQEYGLSSDIGSRVRYCGYVLRPDDPVIDAYAPPDTDGKPLVLATAGGGEDGIAVMEAFAAAAEGADWAAAMITGPLGDATRRRRLGVLAAERGIAFHRFVPDMGPWLEKASAAVTMGGYNTLIEAASRGVPVVCVPRVRPRTEQLIRAQAFDRHGLLRMIHPDELSPGMVRRQIDEVLDTDERDLAARARSVLGMDGAQAAAVHLLELAAGKVSVVAAS